MVRLVLALTILLQAITTAQALVVDGKIIRQFGVGKFVLLATDNPFAVGNDNFDTDNLYAFDEDQNIVLPNSIRVDIGGDGGIIPEGETVASHYVFFDSFSGYQEGYVDFDAPILGIAVYQDTMAATDFLANNAVTYMNPILRGLEQGDLVWIDPDNPNRLWVSWAASTPGDYIRVFTEKSLGVIG